MELSAEALKVLHPREVFTRFALVGARPDGRSIAASRKVGINTRTISSCDGSAVVRLGGTTVAAGVQAVPIASLPHGSTEDSSLVNVSLQIPPACSSRFRRSGFSEAGAGRAACIAQVATDLLRLAAVLDDRQLRVDETPVVRLEVNAVCTTFDGNIEDAAILAVMCAVSTTTLPAMLQQLDGSWVLDSGEVGSAPPALSSASAKTIAARPLRLACFPVPLTSACVRLAAAGAAEEACEAHGSLIIVADPTSDEEALSTGSVTAVAALELSPGGHSPTPRMLLVSAAGEALGAADLRACELAAHKVSEQRAAELRGAVEG